MSDKEAMVKATPLYSAGARYERAALRAKLEREMKRSPGYYTGLLRWVKSRQSRYNKKPGGL